MARLKKRVPPHDPVTGAPQNDAVVLDPTAAKGPADTAADEGSDVSALDGLDGGEDEGRPAPSRNWDQFFRDLRRGKR